MLGQEKTAARFLGSIFSSLRACVCVRQFDELCVRRTSYLAVTDEHHVPIARGAATPTPTKGAAVSARGNLAFSPARGRSRRRRRGRWDFTHHTTTPAPTQKCPHGTGRRQRRCGAGRYSGRWCLPPKTPNSSSGHLPPLQIKRDVTPPIRQVQLGRGKQEMLHNRRGARYIAASHHPGPGLHDPRTIEI